MDYLNYGQFRNFGDQNELIKSQFLTHQLLLIVNTQKKPKGWRKSGHFLFDILENDMLLHEEFTSWRLISNEQRHHST